MRYEEPYHATPPSLHYWPNMSLIQLAAPSLFGNPITVFLLALGLLLLLLSSHLAGLTQTLWVVSPYRQDAPVATSPADEVS